MSFLFELMLSGDIKYIKMELTEFDKFEQLKTYKKGTGKHHIVSQEIFNLLLKYLQNSIHAHNSVAQ
jgi:hypothetical protein